MAILGTVTGTINTLGEHDWFKLNLSANTLYSLTSTSGHVFAMHDALGNVIPSGDASGGYSTGGTGTNGIAFMPITSEPYYVDVSLPGGLGNYNIRVTELPDDYRSNISTSGAVAVGGTVSGVLDAPGDHDWIKLTLSANTLYEITASGDTFTQIRVLDGTGAALPTLDNFGGFRFGESGGVGVGFMPVVGGTYFVDVASSGAVGAYSVKLATSPDDYRNNTSTTGEVAVGATVTGVVNVTGDHDWFKVSLQANTLYELKASNATLVSMAILQGDGQIVTDLDASGTTGFQGTGAQGIGFMPKVTGDYFIDIGSAVGAGPYSLSVTASPDDLRNNISTSGTVAVGGSAAGVVNTWGDHDWLRVNLTANTLYAITAPGAAAGQLSMFDANGTEVDRTDSFGTGSLGFTPVTTGTYFVDFSSGAGPANYTIAVATSPDDYTSNVGTSGVVATGGSASGTVNVVGDHDWFKVSLNASTLYSITASGIASPNLSVRNSSGTEVGTLDGFGSGSLGYMPASTGVYYIDLSSASATATGNYTLNVTTVVDDHRNNATATGTVTGAPSGVAGTPDNDILAGGAGNDVIDGLAGTDTVLSSGNRASYALSKTASGYALADGRGRDGTDTLLNIERIKFADLGLALDVAATQSAGKAQLLLGGVLGKDVLAQKKSLVGTGIDLFDQGLSMRELSGTVMRLEIWGLLANGGNASASNTQIANYLLTTVFKAAPSAAALAASVAALDTELGAAQGTFLSQLVESAANQTQVGLVGLAATGLEFGF